VRIKLDIGSHDNVAQEAISRGRENSIEQHPPRAVDDDVHNVIESLLDSPSDNMPPKGPAAKDKDIAPVEEDLIQAVILAESFNKRFKPLTIDRPRAS